MNPGDVAVARVQRHGGSLDIDEVNLLGAVGQKEGKKSC